MSRFVDRRPVPVQLEGDDDIIWIKPKMDLGTRKKVQSAMVRSVSTDSDGETIAEVDLGKANMVLLENNIVKWEGPGFDGKPFTPENLRQLDPDDPLLEKALEEINARNARKDPKEEELEGNVSSGPSSSGLKASK